MPLILKQTDSAADDGFDLACSGLATGATVFSREASPLGSYGTSEIVPTQTANKTHEGWLAFESDVGEPGLSSWNAGDYTMRLDVTTGDMNVRWTQAWWCERESGGTMNVFLWELGFIVALNAGVQGRVFNLASPFAAAASSTLYVMLGMFWNSTMGTAAAGITPDVDIDTPIQALAVETPGVGAIAMRRAALSGVRRMGPRVAPGLPPWEIHAQRQRALREGGPDGPDLLRQLQ